uniref:Uncharacterized protein n=1 Tax=Sphaerodactylus townsendi TaxID=933632 RepID=A0ACB8FVK3_9SAUR
MELGHFLLPLEQGRRRTGGRHAGAAPPLRETLMVLWAASVANLPETPEQVREKGKEASAAETWSREIPSKQKKFWLCLCPVCTEWGCRHEPPGLQKKSYFKSSRERT